MKNKFLPSMHEQHNNRMKCAAALGNMEPLKRALGVCPKQDQLPTQKALKEVVSLARAALFPSFYGDAARVEENVWKLAEVLSSQIEAAISLVGNGACKDEVPSHALRAMNLTESLIERLPALRDLLLTDVEAAYEGDPAATSQVEIVCCYPVLKALINYRLAHELYKLGVPLVPRMITEMAHSETGIDIHPAAVIGSHFTIDHGTGVVIGETCVIGQHVKLYQGVTLGARSFPLDDNGNPIKAIMRHPILGNRVIVYSNSTLLGRIHIGDDVVIGGNVWLTHDVASGCIVRQTKPNIVEQLRPGITDKQQ